MDFITVLFICLSIIGESCHKYKFCRDRSFVTTNTKTCLSWQKACFVMTKLLSWQIFVVTNMCLSRQRLCLDKHTFVTTKDMFCCDKQLLVVTEVCLFCHDKIMLVAANICHDKIVVTKIFCLDKHNFLWQNFCHNKHTFVMTRDKHNFLLTIFLSRQAYMRQKMCFHVFVTTKVFVTAKMLLVAALANDTCHFSTNLKGNLKLLGRGWGRGGVCCAKWWHVMKYIAMYFYHILWL